jgi:hypothetical protein
MPCRRSRPLDLGYLWNIVKKQFFSFRDAKMFCNILLETIFIERNFSVAFLVYSLSENMAIGSNISATMFPHSSVSYKAYNSIIMDDSSYRLNFDPGKKNKILHHS